MTTSIFGFILIIFTSMLAGWLLSRSKAVELPVKIMVFMLYFWVYAFIQLIIFALLYQFGFLEFFE